MRALAVIVLSFLLPFGWLLVASVQPGSGLSADPGAHFSAANFAAVLNTETIFRPMLNSSIISGGTAILTVLVAVLAAYPLSRYRAGSAGPSST